MSLEVEVEKPSDCERHVTVTISRDDIDRYLDDEFDELMESAEVPGFRKGRAPKKLVRSRFQQDVSDRIKGRLLMDALSQVSDEQEFSAISEPDFAYDKVEIPTDGPLVFEFDIEVRPEFELPEWKGLKLEKPSTEVTDEEITAHLNQLRERDAELEPYDGKAELGDYVICDIKFTLDGKKVAELDEASIPVRKKLSFADALLEDFDTLMVGAAEGDKKTTELTLSENAAGDLSNKTVTAEFKVLDVKRMALPEVDDEYMSQFGEFETVDDFRKAIASSLENQLSYRSQQKIRDEITAQLLADADWSLPPGLLRRQAKRELERTVLELQYSGFDDGQIQAHSNSIRRNAEAATERSLKQHFIFEKIAEKEEVEPAPQDYEMEVMRIAMQERESPRKVRARLERSGGIDALRNQILERQVLQLIEQEAEIFEVPAEKPEEDGVAAVDFAIAGANDSEEDATAVDSASEEK
ncbi:MAG: trigger factor [bacterium]|nr:trigger factor [bacterium]